MRLLVTGLNGQVVTALSKLSGRDGLDIVCIGRPELDLAHTGSIAPALEKRGGDVIVNAAAWTAVDKAEEETAASRAINADGAGAVAEASAKMGVPVIQISTDYVFAGDKDAPYTEADPTAPQTVYGQTKLEGERFVAAANPRHAILRTAWVYSETGGNFLKTMLRVARDRPQLRVVADQLGSPTHADDIAAGIVTIARNLVEDDTSEDQHGVFHMVARGYTSWHGFAEAIFKASKDQGGPTAEVEPIPTRDYPTPAPRPANSRLDCSQIEAVHGVRMRDWQAPIDETVRQVLKN